MTNQPQLETLDRPQSTARRDDEPVPVVQEETWPERHARRTEILRDSIYQAAAKEYRRRR